MYNKPIILSIAMLAALNIEAQKVNEYSVLGSIPYSRPLLCDSIDNQGKKFGNKNLLNQKVNLRQMRRNAHTETCDSVLTLERPTTGETMHVVETKIIAPRYAEGNLLVTSQAPFQILIDGKAVSTKEKAQDSISSASIERAKITLKPQVESIVTVKLLADANAITDPTLSIEFEPNDSSMSSVRTYAIGKRPIRQYDMIQGPKATSAIISPDGKYMITRFRERFDKDKSRNWATLTDLKTGKIIIENLPNDYKWMPNGSKLYTVKSNGKEFDIYTVEVPSLKETLMVEGIPKKDFTWSPNEDYIIYSDYDAGIPNDGPLRRYKDPDDRIPGNRGRSTSIKYDIATGLEQPIIFGNRNAHVGDFNADGSKALLMVSNYDITEYPFYFSDLLELDMNTLEVDTLISHDPWINQAVYSPDGKQLFILGSPSAFNNIGLNCGNHPIPSPEDTQGFIFDIASKEAKPMTRDFNPSISGTPVWNKKDGNIYFRATDGFNIDLCQLNPTTGKIEKLPQDITTIHNFSIGNQENEWIAYAGGSYDAEGRAYLYNLKNKKLSLIADPWASFAEDIELGKTEPYNFTASDGTEIEGFLTFPPGFDPNQKYPMIVYYYGGCVPTDHNVTGVMGPQQYASRGYVVYTINPSGCTGYGQEFSARHVNAWGDYTANDIIEGVKHVIADKDFINPDKVGCTGASYGGFMTQYLLTLTDIFATAVSHAGISNVASYWGEGNWGYSYNTIAAAESYPWNNPDLFTKHGSLFNADKINTPLLLLHGTVDDNVPPGESIQLFNALKILGKDVELITVEGENHGVTDWEKRLQWQDAYMAWFAKYLQDDPTWWDALYGE